MYIDKVNTALISWENVRVYVRVELLNGKSRGIYSMQICCGAGIVTSGGTDVGTVDSRLSGVCSIWYLQWILSLSVDGLRMHTEVNI